MAGNLTCKASFFGPGASQPMIMYFKYIQSKIT